MNEKANGKKFGPMPKIWLALATVLVTLGSGWGILNYRVDAGEIIDAKHEQRIATVETAVTKFGSNADHAKEKIEDLEETIKDLAEEQKDNGKTLVMILTELKRVNGHPIN